MWCVKDRLTAIDYTTGKTLPLGAVQGKVLGLTESWIKEGMTQDMIFDTHKLSDIGKKAMIGIPYSNNDFILYNYVKEFKYYNWRLWAEMGHSLATEEYTYVGNGVFATYGDWVSSNNKAFCTLLEVLCKTGLPENHILYTYCGTGNIMCIVLAKDKAVDLLVTKSAVLGRR